MTNAKESSWGVIVIGSGMGGMAAAAALSKVGHKVLLLEQYQTLGGLTHSFSREGFTWDAGIHYLSGVAPGEPARDLLDWLSTSPIEFVSMGAPGIPGALGGGMLAAASVDRKVLAHLKR